MDFKEAVAADPEILGGALCFRGTRVPIQNLFDSLMSGHSVDHFLEGFNWISRDQVIAVLDQSIRILEKTTKKTTDK